MSDIATKSNRIASAIYLITGFFSDQEPLKWNLRSVSNELVSEKVKDKFSVAKQISTLCYLAKAAGLISDPNYDILSGELSKFIEEANRPLLSDVFLDNPSSNKYIAQSSETVEVKDNLIKDIEVSKPILKKFGAVSVKKNGRQSTIIAILKRKKEVMIKDIMPLIDGCGEKTIQRELTEMVRLGILKKIGDKRWSRYTLSQSNP